MVSDSLLDKNTGRSIKMLKTSAFAEWAGTVATTSSLLEMLDSHSVGSYVRKQQLTSRPDPQWEIGQSVKSVF